MGLSLGDFTRAVEAGEHEVAHAMGNALIRVGHASSDTIRSVLNRLPGGMHLGSRLEGARGPHPGNYIVKPGKMPLACGVSQKGKPFCLNGYKKLAAGAQTQGTDLVNFHAAASNPTVISTDNLIPGSVTIESAHLTISARAITTTGFEGMGFLDSFWLVEYINGTEWARWSIRRLALLYGYQGTLTSGNVADTQKIDIPDIPFPREYDPNTKYATTLQCSVTTTTILDLDCSFVETGYRP